MTYPLLVYSTWPVYCQIKREQPACHRCIFLILQHKWLFGWIAIGTKFSGGREQARSQPSVTSHVNG